MRRFLFVALTLIFVLAVCGNSGSSDKNSGLKSSSSNSDRKILRVGTEGTYAPSTFHDKKDRSTGYDIDVIKAVAKEKGYKLKFNETSWDSMFAGLDAKRFDVTANQVGINKERKERYKFSNPYTYSSDILVVRDDKKNIKSFDDVKGKRLTQTFTSNYGKLAKDKGTNITKVDGFDQSIDLLLSKRVSDTFNDSLSYLDYKKQEPNARIETIKGDAEQNKSTFAFSKNVDNKVVSDFNDGLEKLKKNGELAKIDERWFGENVSEPK